MTNERFDVIVVAWLHDDARHRVPDHLDNVLAVTATTSQRRLPWSTGRSRQELTRIARLAAFAAAVLLILAAMLAIGVGGGRPVLGPMADAPASNDVSAGLVREALDGVMAVTLDRDLYLVDADGSDLRPVVIGPTIESDVQFSPNGKWLAFTQWDRLGPPELWRPNRVMLAYADGRDIRPVFDAGADAVTHPLMGYAWAPGGDQIAVLSRGNGGDVVTFVDATEPTSRHVLDLPADISFGSTTFGFKIAWRPQDGGQLLLTAGGPPTTTAAAIYAIGVDGTGFRKILELEYDYAELSPDGRWLGYFEYTGRRGSFIGARVHLVDLDSGVDRVLSSGQGPVDEELHFSVDGTTGVMITCTRIEHDQCRVVRVPLDASAPGRDLGSVAVGPTPKERWLVSSPDGRYIIVEDTYAPIAPPMLIDVGSGARSTLNVDYLIQDWGPPIR